MRMCKDLTAIVLISSRTMGAAMVTLRVFLVYMGGVTINEIDNMYACVYLSNKKFGVIHGHVYCDCFWLGQVELTRTGKVC